MTQNPMSSPLNALKQRLFDKIGPECEGSIALYQENPHACCVRVSNIRSDDWGVKITITNVPMAGMRFSENPARQSAEIGCAWIVFSPNPSEWYARYGWRLFFDSDLVEAVKALGTQLAGEGKLLEYNQAQMCVMEHRARKHAAGISPRART